MKKTVVVFLLLPFFLSYTSAQELDLNYLPEIGDQRITKRTNNLDELDSGPFGLNQEWDFSQIDYDTLFESSQIYSLSSSLDTNLYFPQSNLALQFENLVNAVNYYRIEGNWVFLLGNTNGQSRARFNPPITRFTLPMEYQSSAISTGESFFITNQDTFQNYIQVERTFDGYGNLKTPTGEFEDCIRVKEVFKSSAVPVFDNAIVSTRYYWYQGKISNQMAISTQLGDDTNAVYNFEWQENLNDLVSSNSEISDAQFEISHLGNGSFNITAPNGHYQADLYTISGSKISSLQWTQTVEQSRVQIPMDQALKGQMLLLLLWDTENGSFKAKKFYW